MVCYCQFMGLTDIGRLWQFKQSSAEILTLRTRGVASAIASGCNRYADQLDLENSLIRADGAQSFLLPQYGGVAFYNLPREAPAQAHHLPLQALSPSFHLFTQHLYSLLALPPLPTPNPFDPSRTYTSFSPFQLETLMRVRAAENVEEAQKTLAGITRLVDKIKEMKVGEGVRGKVLGALERLETVS